MRIRKAKIIRKDTNKPVCEFTVWTESGMDVKTQAVFVLLSLDLSRGWADPTRIYDLLVAIRNNQEWFIEEMCSKYEVIEDEQVNKLNGDEPLSVKELLWNN